MFYFDAHLVLKLLDRTKPEQRVPEDEDEENDDETRMSHSSTMSPWLLDELSKAEVIDVIRPFWSSLYKQVSIYYLL